MEADPRDDWSGARAYIAVLIGFKLVGLGIVVWAMGQAGMLEGAPQFLIAYHVPFILPPTTRSIPSPPARLGRVARRRDSAIAATRIAGGHAVERLSLRLSGLPT